MLTIRDKSELSLQIKAWKQQGNTISFVPTMGNLHQGHLSLVEQGHKQADKLVSSVFVNPMQFGPSEDLASYPRTLEADTQWLKEKKCDLLYIPESKDLFPEGIDNTSRVIVPELSSRLEGEFRPTHFPGVSTIVLKLFNLVQPDIAVFGKKDYQQWRMIEKMVHDLNIPVKIIAGETVRDNDGLAMSSRNQYLKPEQRAIAPKLRECLLDAADKVKLGSTIFSNIENEATNFLINAGFTVEYFSICKKKSLNSGSPEDDLVIVSTVRMGTTRLLDNIEI